MKSLVPKESDAEVLEMRRTRAPEDCDGKGNIMPGPHRETNASNWEDQDSI